MEGSPSPVASNMAQVSESGGTSASDSSHTDDSQQSSPPRRKQLMKKDPHPPGFRTLVQRLVAVRETTILKFG